MSTASVTSLCDSIHARANGRPGNVLLLDRLADREANAVLPLRFIGIAAPAV
jgi:hypothetical protein